MLQTRTKKRSEEHIRRVVELLDRYGPLLTEKQYHFAVLHYRDGKSLSAIARDKNVSRQAIHDAVSHARKMLEEYHSKLCDPAEPATKQQNICQQQLNLVRSRLESLRMKVARQGIIYSTDWINAELRSAITDLEMMDSATHVAQFVSDK
jgi:predicted DNA-binding protein YlxM (UPF0122 family)